MTSHRHCDCEPKAWQEAIQLEKDLIRAAMEGKLGAHSAPTRLFDACDKFLTAKEATANTKRAVEFDREMAFARGERRSPRSTASNGLSTVSAGRPGLAMTAIERSG